jgi:putative transposase
MPEATIIEITAAQQAWMLRELRRCRYGHLLALHILLLLAGGKTPTEIADFLLCSRASVYRAKTAWSDGTLLEQWWPSAPEPLAAGAGALNHFQRTLRWLVNQPPRLFGWCRTRWSCAALALTINARTQVQWSRETVRRELRAQGYVWKRAKLKAKNDDPQRAQRLARIRARLDNLRTDEALFWCDELDVHLLAKVGYQWMPVGTQVEIATPGQNEKLYLAGALDYRTGEIIYVIGPRKTNWLFRQLLALLASRCGPCIKRIYIVADNYRIHKAKAVEQWLATQPRFEILWLPSYCPQANPIERAFGDVHDKCTRNHTRQVLRWLLWDVKQHLARNGPWKYKLPSLYYEPEVETELTKLYLADSLKQAA